MLKGPYQTSVFDNLEMTMAIFNLTILSLNASSTEGTAWLCKGATVILLRLNVIRCNSFSKYICMYQLIHNHNS